MRPVFNCSLKTQRDKPYLNEDTYAGINLMQDMLELQMLFRTEDFVLLGDLKKAFLQIKLKSEKDMNCFCFFIRDGGELDVFIIPLSFLVSFLVHLC